VMSWEDSLQSRSPLELWLVEQLMLRQRTTSRS
jgi:hypothetical protein